jgi:hypothetical protein
MSTTGIGTDDAPTWPSMAPSGATLKDATRRLRRWPAAILDRGSARRPGECRPGRRNDLVQPNKETGERKLVIR